MPVMPASSESIAAASPMLWMIGLIILGFGFTWLLTAATCDGSLHPDSRRRHWHLHGRLHELEWDRCPRLSAQSVGMGLAGPSPAIKFREPSVEIARRLPSDAADERADAVRHCRRRDADCDLS